MNTDADRLVSRLEALDATTAQTAERTAHYQQMTENLRQVQGTASSPDGVVTVAVAPGGAVQQVRFTDGVRTADPGKLGAAVQSAIAVAQANAAKAQAEIVRNALGDSELLDLALAAEIDTFGDQPPKAVAAPVSVRSAEDNPEPPASIYQQSRAGRVNEEPPTSNYHQPQPAARTQPEPAAANYQHSQSAGLGHQTSTVRKPLPAADFDDDEPMGSIYERRK